MSDFWHGVWVKHKPSGAFGRVFAIREDNWLTVKLCTDRAWPRRVEFTGEIARWSKRACKTVCKPRPEPKVTIDEPITAADVPEAVRIDLIVEELSRLRVNKADSICLTYRHDFGLLEADQQRKIRKELRGWLDCIVSEVMASKLRGESDEAV